MNEIVILFRDPALGRDAGRALADLFRAGASDDRIAMSASGSILVVRVRRDERSAVRRLMDRLGGSVMYDESEALDSLDRAG